MYTPDSTQTYIDERPLLRLESTHILDANNIKTLAEFVKEAHLQIADGTLKLKTYRKVVKKLLFELAATIHWFHTDRDCMFNLLFLLVAFTICFTQICQK